MCAYSVGNSVSLASESQLKVGDLNVPGRVYLAPMAGITDQPFRDVAISLGAPVVVSEMVASEALLVENPEMIRKCAPAHGRLHIVQLAGRDPELLAKAARYLTDSGVDIIDFNMGCPSKRVISGYCGAALMRDEPQAAKLITAIVSNTHLPVTVKMRLGWDETQLNAPQIAHMAQECGVQAIAVHGRTRKQFYKGQADWSAVQAVREAISLPLIVNGDILNSADARVALEKSGADGVMIGRGAQGAPWITAQVAAELDGRTYDPPAGKALAELIIRHYDAILDHYGVDIGVRVARKHLGWYLSANHPAADSVRPVLMRSVEPEEVRDTIRKAFEYDVSEVAA